MAVPETNRFSYIRAVREVMPSVQLEKFLAKAVRIGKVALGFKESTFLQWPATLEEELSEDYKPISEGIGLAAATIYPANKLRYTHFENLSLPDDRQNRLISRVYSRAVSPRTLRDRTLLTDIKQAGEKYGIFDNSNLALKVNDITVSTKPQYRSRGEEYALGLCAQPEADILAEQNDVILRFVRSTGPGSELCRGAQPSSGLEIPFAVLPVSAEESQKEKFVSWMIDCLHQQALHISLGPVEWESKIRQ